MGEAADIDLLKQGSVVEQLDAEMEISEPNDAFKKTANDEEKKESEPEKETNQRTEKVKTKKKPALKKIATVVGMSAAAFLVIAGSFYAFKSYQISKQALEESIANNSNGLQLLYDEMISLREDFKNLDTNRAIYESMQRENKELTLVLKSITETHAALTNDVERTSEKINALSQSLNQLSGLETQITELKEEVQEIQKAPQTQPAQSNQAARTRKAVTINQEPVKPTGDDGPNLRLISVDRWAGTAQAVFKTPDGITIFMNQGERKNGWQLISIDFHSSTALMSNGVKTKHMTITM